MEVRLHTAFYARMMGGFSLWFQDREVEIHANLQTKYMQFLLLLLKAGMNGVERKQLISLLHYDTEPEKQVNNFYQQMFLLRKVIAGLSFPEGKYIVKRKGRYYFTLDYLVEADTDALDRIIDQLKKRAGLDSEEEKQRLFQEYCRKYTGEFLPMLEGEEWVVQESAYYQRWFGKCAEGLCRQLKERGEQEKVLELSAAASQMHPYDGWQKVQIESLMIMGRYHDALAVYEQSSRLFYHDLGVNPLDEVMERFQKDSKEPYQIEDNMLEIMEKLAEPEGEQVQEAYYCSYPSFVDAYRMIVRNGERLKRNSLLMSCTLLDCREERKVLGEKEREDGVWIEKMEHLRKVLASGLRTEDVYTRYGQQQFLVLLTGANKPDGEGIRERLEYLWDLEDLGREIKLNIEIQKAGESEVEEGENAGNGYVCCTYCEP